MNAARRLLLLPEPRPAPEPSAPKIRRYRLARVRIAEAREETPPRFAHLRRSYD